MKSLHVLSTVAVLAGFAGTASAQLTIARVVNAASRQGPGIAQGALFAVGGKGIGPDQPDRATFPLPTTDGLDGVTIQLSSSGQLIDCIMVYVKPNEVGAILPSSAPLGPATVTVNNNGLTASADITVVAAAFGIFTQTLGTGGGLAIAFNVNSDGSTALNSTVQSVQPEQDILINGTGLGAITSDETQSGVTDVPTTAFQIYVGVVPATVVSFGRGSCCDGIDPSYPVPQGIAAWDVIRFTIPDGVVGCYIPIVVQIGTVVSNLATISIDPSGAACTPPPSLLSPDLIQQLSTQTGVAIGSVSLGRGFGFNVTAAGKLNNTQKDTGSATFVSYPNLAASNVTPQTIYPNNACTINGFPNPNGVDTTNGNTVTITPLKSVPFDAGTPITVKGPAGARSIVKRTAGAIFDYPSVTFGDTSPGNYFDPGSYTVAAPGGKDVGQFTGTTTVPDNQFTWTNIVDVTVPIDRTQDLTFTWTGGVPGTQVTVGAASDVAGVNGAILCAAAVEAGQLTVPSYVWLSLPATGTSTTRGQLTVGNDSVTLFSAPGLDYGTLRYGLNYTTFVKYQ